MRKYEAMYILKPDLEQEATKELVEKFQNIITNNGGEIEKLEEMGKRRLAYEIEDYNDGYYVLVNFKSEPAVVAELDRVFRITDGVIRYLIIKDVK
ncbi:30S ribosomal protein S6 [Vulcanibacillus modesticaldus]|uniref:Small ribosomal subunit protein bS6 n=1 Tax=Vulcanibacillus modesticaldus TaxID=337097 RepID=A0A1D2YVB3_9BACI|nr:30S ribosomal protein S6 [Vulcanibacillus modesticaldus]OEF99672.1 30S ribosomal protein S6 [Vulcanibacillus modesticaldus]